MNTRERTAPALATNTAATTTTTLASTNYESVTLRLRGEEQHNQEKPPARRIRWAENVVNNEGMGKRSSKVCCIYRKAREVGESSSEESDTSSNSDSDDEDSAERKRCHNKECGHAHDVQRDQPAKTARKPSPNAYEKQPRSVTGKPGPHS